MGLLVLSSAAPIEGLTLDQHDPRFTREALCGFTIQPGAVGWECLNPAGERIANGTHRAVLSARSAAMIASYGRGYVNLPAATLGGKQYWADELIRCGWRVQRNVKTGHYRLLDADDRRRAWRSFEACCAVLEERRVRLGLEWESDRLVVLLPGIVRSKDALARLEADLRKAGYATMAVNYASTQADLEAHADQIQILLEHTPGMRQVSFVGHSLGGLVARIVSARRPDGPMPGVSWGRCCMLFTPNQGAQKADRWHDRWWYRQIFGPAGESLTTANAAHIPKPAMPFAVIAGGRGDGQGRSWLIDGDDDGTVAVANTELDGMEDHQVFDVGHTFGMNDPAVRAAVLSYLAHGSLSPETVP